MSSRRMFAPPFWLIVHRRESMIDHDRKLLFIHIARTGGTSIECALVGEDWWNIQSETKHLSARQARKYYGEKIWNSYTKFSVVRNPWNRVVSMWATGWWHDTELTKDASLEDFVRRLKPHQYETYNSLCYYDILNEEIDYILRFESLQEDFDVMLKNIGVQKIILPHKEARVHKHYRELHSKKAKLLVGEIFADDILKYGYNF